MNVPKETISEVRLIFLCQKPDIGETPNRDVFIGYEEGITHFLPQLS